MDSALALSHVPATRLELMNRAREPWQARFARWTATHRVGTRAITIALVVIPCVLVMLVPSIALAGWLEDLEHFIRVDLLGGVCASLFNAAVDAVSSMMTSADLTAGFSNLLGDYSTSGIVGLCESVANSVIKPCANTILTLVVLFELFKIASEMDKNGGTLPAVREVVKLFVMLAIFLYIVNNGFELMEGLFDLCQRIVNAIGQQLYADSVTNLEFESGDFENVAAIGDMIFMLILALFIFLASILATVVAQFMFLARGLEIYVLSMFAPLPFSLIGLSETRSWAIGYIKQFIQVCLSGAIIMVILYIIPALLNVAIADAKVEWGTMVTLLDCFWIIKMLAIEILCIFMLVKSGSLAGKILGSVG